MLDAVVAALATDGIWMLFTGALVAGIVRGFAGFGTAMVYLPVAAQVVGPFEALTTLIIIDLTGPLIHVPRAIRDGHPGDVLRLGLGAALAVPLGVWVLSLVEPEVFRYGVSIVALILLTLLIAGVRYHGQLTKPMIFGTGALGGFLGGSVGVPGPPVIMLYMASTLPPRVVRATLMFYLVGMDLLMLGYLASLGFLESLAVVTGLFMAVPYMIFNKIGAQLFGKGSEAQFRWAAYLIIAASAIVGLPIWS